MKRRRSIGIALVAALLAATGCEEAVREQPLDASDAASDGASSIDAATSIDGAVAGCSEGCPAFERCVADRCECGPDPACGSGGYARFAIPSVAAGAAHYEVGAETVRDTVTGLLWERATDGLQRTWAEAATRCETLALGGREDWRLPTRIELLSIVHPERSPNVVPDVFDAVRSDYYWSASRPAQWATSAFSVYFGQGEVAISDALGGGAFVRCVAAPATTTDRQFDVAQATVRDRGTGLVWQRRSDPALDQEAAAAHCESLVLDGASDFRLPSVAELASIVDEGRTPAIDRRVFDAPDDLVHWSASIRDFGEVFGWSVSFADGTTLLESRSTEHPVRCVR